MMYHATENDVAVVFRIDQVAGSEFSSCLQMRSDSTRALGLLLSMLCALSVTLTLASSDQADLVRTREELSELNRSSASVGAGTAGTRAARAGSGPPGNVARVVSSMQRGLSLAQIWSHFSLFWVEISRAAGAPFVRDSSSPDHTRGQSHSVQP